MNLKNTIINPKKGLTLSSAIVLVLLSLMNTTLHGQSVKTGIDVLQKTNFAFLHGKKVGVLLIQRE